MDIKRILAAVDHTQLSVCATQDDIIRLCDEATEFKTASVCIPPCYVSAAKSHVGARMRVCTVIGFPNGYSGTLTKVYETERALADGADEIDTVINIGMLKGGDYGYILNEIKQIKAACRDKILKVIIETCLLDRPEKIKMCKIVADSGADFIKTSTGFSTGGATVEDIILFKENLPPRVKIKAAGGIATPEDAEAMLDAGASRLGTSRIIKLIRKERNNKK